MSLMLFGSSASQLMNDVTQHKMYITLNFFQEFEYHEEPIKGN